MVSDKEDVRSYIKGNTDFKTIENKGIKFARPIKTKTMRALKLFYEQRLISHNIKPYKVVKLKTGIKAEHYVNGDIKIVKIWVGMIF